MKEQHKYEVIKSVVDHDANKNRAVLELGVTRRTVDRMICGYRSKGKAFFSHKNHGRRPATALDPALQKRIVKLYQSKYYDCSYQLFTELLASKEKITVSVSTVRSILMSEYLLSPRAKKATIRNIKKELTAKKEQSKSKRVINQIDSKLLDLEDAHPRHPRKANFGEELQMDASEYLWFGDTITHLHAAIDDATGKITGAYFDWQETLQGYYHVFEQTLSRYGIPYKFRTDRRTVFEYKLLAAPKPEQDTYTQFAYACKQLGVQIETTSIPQGKGRIERLFCTLKGRLPVLMRLAGVQTIEQANEFLTSYLDEFNAQFALTLDGIPSVFETQPSKEKMNLTLAVLSSRQIDRGCCVKYFGTYYRPVDHCGIPQDFRSGLKGLVIKALDGSLFFSIDERILALQEVPLRDAYSKDFSPAASVTTPKKRTLPSPSHPWRSKTFEQFRTAGAQGHKPPAA